MFFSLAFIQQPFVFPVHKKWGHNQHGEKAILTTLPNSGRTNNRHKKSD
jgi:hypothetical protein